MRRFSPESLTRIGCALFEAAGCSEVDARTVAEHLVESSLFGHDSHGTLRLYEYIDQIEAGTFDAKGRPRVVRERGSTAILDGGGALGAVAGRLAVERAVALARAHGVATVTLRNCSHLGRIGAYPLALARQGLLAMALANARPLGRQLPPLCRIDCIMSPNPFHVHAPPPAGHPPPRATTQPAPPARPSTPSSRPTGRRCAGSPSWSVTSPSFPWCCRIASLGLRTAATTRTRTTPS